MLTISETAIQQPYKGQIEESNPTLLNALSNLALSSMNQDSGSDCANKSQLREARC